MSNFTLLWIHRYVYTKLDFPSNNADTGCTGPPKLVHFTHAALSCTDNDPKVPVPAGRKAQNAGQFSFDPPARFYSCFPPYHVSNLSLGIKTRDYAANISIVRRSYGLYASSNFQQCRHCSDGPANDATKWLFGRLHHETTRCASPLPTTFNNRAVGLRTYFISTSREPRLHPLQRRPIGQSSRRQT